MPPIIGKINPRICTINCSCCCVFLVRISPIGDYL
jgi:hypothetical protein